MESTNYKEKKYSKEEEMLIIKKYQDMILYVYQLLKKYPATEKYALVSETKKYLFDGLELLFYAKKAYGKQNKMNYLNQFDVKLNSIQLFVRIARKQNYINPRNYRAWSYKITFIRNMMGGWVNECLAH